MTLLIHPQTKTALDNYHEKPTHAVLLSGVEGLGKTHLALQLVADTLQVSLEKIDGHPYILRVSPEKGAIAIEVVRKLQEFVAHRVPGKASFKRAMIVEDIDSMTIPAQNAFLKLVEEPPKDTIIVATTSHLQKVLPTIRSRMSTLAVLAPSDEQVRAHFTSTEDVSEDTFKRARMLYGDNLANIESVLQRGDTVGNAFDRAKDFLGASQFERLVEVQTLSKDREEAIQLCEALATIAELGLKNTATEAGLTRWHTVLASSLQAQRSLRAMTNSKLVLTELAITL